MTDRNDDYLWDRSGPPDADVQRLEGLLGRYRYRPQAAGRALGPRGRLGLAAAAALLIALGGVLWMRSGGSGPEPRAADPNLAMSTYRVEGVAGSWGVNSSPWSGGLLRPGDVVETGADGRALLVLPDVGKVEIRESSRVELVDAGEEKHRINLERGTIHASIISEPRVFQVGTKAALAVDLGCIYDLTVDDKGETFLAVHTGRVSLEIKGRKVFVPAGAVCRALPDRGPGVPLWKDAPAALEKAVRALEDSPGRPSRAQVRACLAATLWSDTLTIWHLFEVADPDGRGDVFDKLASIAEPPDGVTRERCVALDGEALEDWRDDIAGLWW